VVIAQIFAIILFSFGAAAFYMGISALRYKYREFRENRLLGLMCLASSVWSFGFGIVFVQRDTSIAYWGRAYGMIGVFVYMMTAQLLINTISSANMKLKKYFAYFTFLGFPIYFLTVTRKAAIFIYTYSGMTYVFSPGLANNVYTLFSVLYAVNVFISIIGMIRQAPSHREKRAGVKFLLAIILIFTGMVLDTIFPLFGLDAVPGSSICQFIGLLVIYYAIVDHNAARVTINNMSSYIYYSVSEPVLVFDIDGKLKFLNASAKNIFPEAIAVEEKDEKRFHGKYEQNRLCMGIDQIFDVDKDYFSFETDTRIDSCDSVRERIPVELHTNRIRDRYMDPIGYIVVVKDMSEINTMMESLRTAKREADEANEAKSVFLANMSHEIRTPLNAIVGFSELMLKEGLRNEQMEQAEDIRTSAQNLLAIINDILDISKIESGRMELVNDGYKLSDVIKDVYLITDTLTSKKGLNFTMQMDENMPEDLFGDRVRVRGVLVNILNNAVKYTREGYVKFTGSLEDTEGDEAVLKFDISDSGIGIKDEEKERLFDSFTQADKKKNSGIEGTGLGLAIVKGYVELMKGSVEVESVYGKGSTFTVRIRQKITNRDSRLGKLVLKSESNQIKSNISSVKFQGVKVLSVDDSRINLKLVEKTLAKYDMIVTSANSGQEAIDLCQENEYDIVLMDQMMPNMNGVEAMRAIRDLSPIYETGGKCKIVALTANAISGVREQLIGEGFDNYLSKPMNFKEVEAVFTEYFAGEESN